MRKEVATEFVSLDGVMEDLMDMSVRPLRP